MVARTLLRLHSYTHVRYPENHKLPTLSQKKQLVSIYISEREANDQSLMFGPDTYFAYNCI